MSSLKRFMKNVVLRLVVPFALATVVTALCYVLGYAAGAQVQQAQDSDFMNTCIREFVDLSKKCDGSTDGGVR